MDWKRAKNILIVMFLIVDLFLAYQLFVISRKQYIYINNDEIESVMQYLNSKNIRLTAEIPSKVFVSPPLKVKYQEFKEADIKSKIFEAGNFSVTDNEESYTVSDGTVEVEVKNHVYLSFTDKSISLEPTNVDEDKCIDNAYKFIEKLGINTSNKYIKAKEIHSNYVRLVLGQEYKGIPVENSYVDIMATEYGIASAKVNWFEYIKPGKKENITTPVVALLSASKRKGTSTEPVTISQIKQGYYYSLDTADKKSENLVQAGTVYPMWVISYNKNEIYVNAYNEKIERVK